MDAVGKWGGIMKSGTGVQKESKVDLTVFLGETDLLDSISIERSVS